MKVSHTMLCQLGALLGYTNLKEGLCAGFSGVWACFILTQSEESLYELLKFMATYKDNFPQLISEIEAAKKKKPEDLTEKEVKLLEIPALYSTIELFLNACKHKDLFNERVNQSDLAKIFNLAKPLSLKSSSVEVILNKNHAFDKDSLKHYLDDLANVFNSQSSPPLPLILGSGEHSICLTFNRKTQMWNYVDTNNFKNEWETNYFQELNSESLANSIFSSFESSEFVAFNTSIMSINPPDSLRQAMKEFDSRYPVKADQINQYEAGNASLLFLACSKGDLDLVKKILKLDSKLDVNASVKSGESPLFMACQNGHLEIVKELLKPEHKINPNLANNKGRTPFMAACENGNLELVAELLKPEYQVDCNQTTKEGASALILACAAENLELVKLLLKPEYKINIHQAYKGRTALALACYEGSTEIVEALLNSPFCDAGIVNQVSQEGLTPLQEACISKATYGKAELFHLLIKHGADFESQSRNGLMMNSMDIALKEHNYAAISVIKSALRRKLDKPITQPATTAFHAACAAGDLAKVQELLKTDGGIDVNQLSSEGESAFFLACKNSRIEVIKELLKPEYGVDVNQKTSKNGASPLLHACINHKMDVIELLLKPEYGVDINQASDDDLRPLFMASSHWNTQVAEALLNSPNCNSKVFNATGIGGTTPLFVACFNRRTEMVKLLLASPHCTADSLKIAGDQGSAIFTACTEGYMDIVKLLLASPHFNVDMLNHKVWHGMNTLQAMCMNPKVPREVFRMVLAQNPNLELVTNDGGTALDIACACKNQNAIQELLLYIQQKQLPLDKVMKVAGVDILFLGVETEAKDKLDYSVSQGFFVNNPIALPPRAGEHRAAINKLLSAATKNKADTNGFYTAHKIIAQLKNSSHLSNDDSTQLTKENFKALSKGWLKEVLDQFPEVRELILSNVSQQFAPNQKK